MNPPIGGFFLNMASNESYSKNKADGMNNKRNRLQ
jgi:hypothetical protein